MIDANDAIWRAKNEAKVDAAIAKLSQGFPGFDPSPDIPRSTEMLPLGAANDLAIDAAAGVLMAQIRNLIVTVVYSQECGCDRCLARLSIVRSVYKESVATLRTLQSIREMGGIVAVASDTSQHVGIIR